MTTNLNYNPQKFQLPKTGQTTSYRTGDDGDFQAGNAYTPRFVDNGDGTVTDNHTSLMWVKQPELIIPGATGVHATNQIQVAKGDWANDTAYAKADLVKDTGGSTYWVCAVAHTSAAAGTFEDDRTANPTYWRQTVWTESAADLTTHATMDWNSSIDNCLTLEYAGYSDWRLPNVIELMSIMNLEDEPPHYSTYFPNTREGSYFSSTTAKNATTKMYRLSFAYPDGSYLAALKTNSYCARPVRGGRINA